MDSPRLLQGATLKQAASDAAGLLATLPGCQPRLEAEVLLAHVLQRARSYLYTWPERVLNKEQADALASLLQRRKAGEPVAYLTGQKEFWSLDFMVTPDTLIPRPETELLVERALQLIPTDAAWTIADLGTGSGNIAAAIKRERPGTTIFAGDLSASALAIAAANFERHGLTDIHCVRGDWGEILDTGALFDMVLSNPPYVADDDPHLLGDGLPWEPHQALTAGVDGLDEIRRIIPLARKHLKPSGWLLLEHGWDQGAPIRELFNQYQFPQSTTWRDAGKRERVTQGQRRKT